MKIVMFGITWGAAQNSIFFPLIILGILLILWRFVKVRKVVGFLSANNARYLLKNFSNYRQIVKVVLLSTGLLFLFFALLRPQWNKKDEIVLQEGRDLFIAVDISRSMLAKDCEPNRLEFVKAKIRKLVNQLKSERIGLIVFAGSTVVQCPLTTDYSAFFMFLNQLDENTISSGTTALDQPIKKALEIFKLTLSKKNKLLVIFTDGEDFSSNLSSIRKEAVKEGMNIFTMGVGTPEGAPVPLINKQGIPAGHMKDKKGEIVISRLNEGILRSLAQETGGVYIRLVKEDQDIKQLVKTVETFEKERLEDKKISELQEQYPYFLIISFICFALEWIL